MQKIQNEPIPVDAHEWVQSLPLFENKLICIRCGYAKQIGSKNEKRCHIHFESPTSGYTDIRTGKHWNGVEWIDTPK